MIASYAHPFPAQSTLVSKVSRVTAVPMQVAGRVFQAVCGLGGHSMVHRFEPNRMFLECMSCGHTTPGWTIRARG